MDSYDSMVGWGGVVLLAWYVVDADVDDVVDVVDDGDSVIPLIFPDVP